MLKKYLYAWLLAGLCCGLTLSAHEFYVSLSQIDYNPEASTLEISIKIFSDDLELALKTLGAEVHADQVDSSETANRYIERYLQRCLIIENEADKLAWQYLGSETEMDVTWCYLEITDLNEPTKLMITNRLLIDIYDEQLNIVHLNIGGQKKSLMLSQNTPKLLVTFREDE